MYFYLFFNPICIELWMWIDYNVNFDNNIAALSDGLFISLRFKTKMWQDGNVTLFVGARIFRE